MADAIVDLIKDLAARLGAVADEFNERAVAMAPMADASSTNASSANAGDLIRRARQLLADRRARRACFPADLFHEPAWEMLVGLFAAQEDPRPVNVKALATYADAPITTCQRWIDHLCRLGLITRTTDPQDRRRIEVALSETGRAAMTAYLAGLPTPLKSH